MSFLSGIFSGQNSPLSSTTNLNTAASAGVSEVTQISQGQGGNLSALFPGKTLQGEVLLTNGQDVLLKLLDGTQLQARLQTSLHLQVGQNLLFEIKTNNGNRVALSPLLENTGMEETVYKALEQARLPVNDQTVYMVTAMMKQGMSVQKDALVSMQQLLNTYADEDMETLLRMKGIGLSVTRDSIAMYRQYASLQYELTESVKGFGEQLAKLETFLSEGQKDVPLLANGKASGMYLPSPEGEKESEIVGTDNLKANPTPNSNLQLFDAERKTETEGQKETTAVVEEQELARLSEEHSETKMDVIFARKNFAEPLETQPIEKTVDTERNAQTVVVTSDRRTEGRIEAELQRDVEPMQWLKKEVEKIFGEEVPVKSAQSISDAITQFLQKKWSLQPEEVQKQKVEDLYNRILNQAGKMQTVLDKIGQPAFSAADSMGNIKNNIDFLQNMNQVMTYIQLPLQMNGKNAHGDLYIYGKGKRVLENQESISALLHLDMEHLGPMNIHVMLKNDKVGTKFCVANEEILDFLEEHLPELDARLKKRGYRLQAECSVETDRRPVMEQILKSTGEERVLLSHTSFDVRA